MIKDSCIMNGIQTRWISADPQNLQAMLADIFGGNCRHFGWKECYIILHGFLEVGDWKYTTLNTKK